MPSSHAEAFVSAMSDSIGLRMYICISIILMKNRKNEQKPLYNEENGLY